MVLSMFKKIKKQNILRHNYFFDKFWEDWSDLQVFGKVFMGKLTNKDKCLVKKHMHKAKSKPPFCKPDIAIVRVLLKLDALIEIDTLIPLAPKKVSHNINKYVNS